jgi:hypothetical protein
MPIQIDYFHRPIDPIDYPHRPCYGPHSHSGFPAVVPEFRDFFSFFWDVGGWCTEEIWEEVDIEKYVSNYGLTLDVCAPLSTPVPLELQEVESEVRAVCVRGVQDGRELGWTTASGQ